MVCGYFFGFCNPSGIELWRSPTPTGKIDFLTAYVAVLINQQGNTSGRGGKAEDQRRLHWWPLHPPDRNQKQHLLPDAPHRYRFSRDPPARRQPPPGGIRVHLKGALMLYINMPPVDFTLFFPTTPTFLPVWAGSIRLEDSMTGCFVSLRNSLET